MMKCVGTNFTLAESYATYQSVKEIRAGISHSEEHESLLEAIQRFIRKITKGWKRNEQTAYS